MDTKQSVIHGRHKRAGESHFHNVTTVSTVPVRYLLPMDTRFSVLSTIYHNIKTYTIGVWLPFLCLFHCLKFLLKFHQLVTVLLSINNCKPNHTIDVFHSHHTNQHKLKLTHKDTQLIKTRSLIIITRGNLNHNW